MTWGAQRFGWLPSQVRSERLGDLNTVIAHQLKQKEDHRGNQ